MKTLDGRTGVLWELAPTVVLKMLYPSCKLRKIENHPASGLISLDKRAYYPTAHWYVQSPNGSFISNFTEYP